MLLVTSFTGCPSNSNQPKQSPPQWRGYGDYTMLFSTTEDIAKIRKMITTMNDEMKTLRKQVLQQHEEVNELCNMLMELTGNKDW